MAGFRERNLKRSLLLENKENGAHHLLKLSNNISPKTSVCIKYNECKQTKTVSVHARNTKQQ